MFGRCINSSRGIGAAGLLRLSFRQHHRPRAHAFSKTRRAYSQRLGADDSVSDAEWKSRLYSWKSVVMCTIPLIAFGLGTWQAQRLKWKLALLEEVNDRMHRRPIALPLRVTQDEVDQNEYRRVIVHGVFDHSNEMLVGPRAMEGESGYMVVTPLVREDGSRILVSRGWIRRDLKDPQARPLSQPTDPLTVVAFVRRAAPRNSFTPEPSPEINQWFNVDVKGMAKHAHTQEVLLDVIKADS
ncbi:surf-like protein, partial [Coemansia sp. RSA 1933]